MKEKVIYLIHVLIFGLLLPSLLYSQKPNFTFKAISQNDGLINGTVQVMFEDSYGFVWIGTQNGLQRYDGTSFQNYEHKNQDSTGIAGNYVYAICEDSEKNIWISSGGLSKYDRTKDQFEIYDIDHHDPQEYDQSLYHAVLSDEYEKDILWITSFSGKLIRLDTKNDSLAIYPFLTDRHRQPLLIPYPEDQNKLLLGSGSLMSFDKSSGEFEELLKLDQNSSIHNNLINAAVLDPTDPHTIWLATGDFWGRGTVGGLVRFNLKTRAKQIFNPENSRGEMLDIHFMSLCPDGNDRLWIGTRYNGALLYIKSQDAFYGYKNNKDDPGSLATSDAVRSIIKDRSGTLWFGTWGDGISQLSPSMQKFTWFKHLPGKKNSLPGNHINTFAEDKDGNIWIGTVSAGLSKFNPDKKSFENFFPDFAATDHPVEITFLFYDSHENLWIATHDDGLFRYDPETGERIHYTKSNSRQRISQNRVTTVTELKKGEILISTYGGGLDIYYYQTDSFRFYINDPDDPGSIPDNQVWLPFMGPDSCYYLSGNSTAGMIRFDPSSEKFMEITEPRRMGTSMMPAKISEREFYVGEIGSGLTQIVFGDKMQINSVLDSEGNRILNTESILVDKNKNLWIGTDNGLIMLDPETNIANRFGPDDGLQGYDFERLTALKASNGEMYFGGKNGFNVFDPDNIEWSDYTPPVIFTDLKLFQKKVLIAEDSPLKENINTIGKLVFDNDQNDFSISFAALDFANPQKIKYKYFLENHDNEWINAGNNNTASYTNMDPGKYVLKVLASNSDGVWNKEPATIQILIRPPWWQTLWAFIIYGLIFIAGIIAVDRYQRRRLLEKQRVQAREKELAQAKEIEKAYEELKTTQKQLVHSEKMASLGELTAGIAHEIQNPLNFINNFSEVNSELISELNAEIDKGELDEAKAIAKDISQNEEKISHHGKRADSIVKGMLQHSRSTNGQKIPTDLNALADEFLRLAYHGLRAKDKSFNADFSVETDNKLPKVNVVPQDIGRVLLNLINNAFFAVSAKASETADANYKPIVVVSTSLIKPPLGGLGVMISVKDNGDGIPDNIKDKIFQPFFTTKPTGEGTGLGLSLSFDIITKGHGGEIKVESEKGQGTQFTITLPI